MANKAASELLRELTETNGEDKAVTTTLSTESMKIIERWQGKKSVKATCAELLRVADEALEETKRVTLATPAKTIGQSM